MTNKDLMMALLAPDHATSQLAKMVVDERGKSVDLKVVNETLARAVQAAILECCGENAAEDGSACLWCHKMAKFLLTRDLWRHE